MVYGIKVTILYQIDFWPEIDPILILTSRTLIMRRRRWSGRFLRNEFLLGLFDVFCRPFVGMVRSDTNNKWRRERRIIRRTRQLLLVVL